MLCLFAPENETSVSSELPVASNLFTLKMRLKLKKAPNLSCKSDILGIFVKQIKFAKINYLCATQSYYR